MLEDLKKILQRIYGIAKNVAKYIVKYTIRL